MNENVDWSGLSVRTDRLISCAQSLAFLVREMRRSRVPHVDDRDEAHHYAQEIHDLSSDLIDEIGNIAANDSINTEVD